MSRKFLLRWKFEYANKPARAGIWLHPGTSDSDKAWSQSRVGLVRALIEAKNVETREITVVAECPGDDFMTFQWVANAALNPFSIGKSMTPLTYLSGLKLLTRHEEIEALVTGEVVRKPPTHLNINFGSL